MAAGMLSVFLFSPESSVFSFLGEENPKALKRLRIELKSEITIEKTTKQ